MKVFKLHIGNKEFKVVVVSTFLDMKKGLAGTKSLRKDRGMLFNFNTSDKVTMNMGNMNYPLDMLFLDIEGEVIKIVTMETTDSPITVDNVAYVLEINKGEGEELENAKITGDKELLKELDLMSEKDEDGNRAEYEGVNIIIHNANIPITLKSKFKEGGTLELIEEEVKMKPGEMQVLDDKGKVLMNIKGGERIFSIKHTEQLINMADKVEKGEATQEDLGKLMAEIIEIHRTQKPQYTDE